jgi:hypothetical protein
MKKVIMTGCPRSGTTALCTLLSHDPNVFITNEIGNFAWEADEFKYRIQDRAYEHHVDWILNLKGIDKDDFIAAVAEDPANYSQVIHERYNIPVVGDKMPGYTESLHDIYHANRDAYYIITLRSVQHFVTSSTNRYHNGNRAYWAFETIEDAQKFWVLTNCKMLENVGKMIPFGAKLLLVRYEEIGPDIDQTIKRISDFIGFEIKVDNPRGGFTDPQRKLKRFTPSSQAQVLMDILGY